MLNMRAGLQIGIESFSWQLSDFTAAAQRAKSLGVDTLIVKIADGTEVWYANLGGGDAWQGVWNVLAAITGAGVQVLPYFFSYGNQFGAFQGEVNVANFVLSRGFDVCLDMESAWNGQDTLAGQLAASLNGPVWVSTWADPALQGWNGVLRALAPKTRFFLPQVYTPFLMGVWQQQYSAAGIPGSQIIPTVNNQTLGVTAGRETITFWEYNQLSDAEIQQSLGGMQMVPSGWTYDPTTNKLTAPNGIDVGPGFVDYVLTNAWDAAAQPYAAQYQVPDLQGHGLGERQDFHSDSLGWTQASGVFRLWLGFELHDALAKIAELEAQPPVQGEPLADAAKAAILAWLGV